MTIKAKVLGDPGRDNAVYVEVDNLPQVACDAVVLAGNIDLECRAFKWVRKQFPDEHVIYVLGTHEYYHRTIPDYGEAFIKAAKEFAIHVSITAASQLTEFNSWDAHFGPTSSCSREND